MTPALAFVVAHTVVLLVWLAAHPVLVDVEVILRESAAYLRAGHNPYTLTFANPYPPDLAGLFFGPGFLVDNRIPYGFPYPPIVLLAAVPGEVLGNVRLVPLLAYAALAVTVHGRGASAPRRALAVALVSLPGSVWVFFGAWTEPLSVALLGFALIAWQRGRSTTAAALLGAVLVSKQYLLVLVPLLWLLRGQATPRRVGALALTGAGLVLPWLLADPVAFYRATVVYSMAAGWRPDSVSLSVELAERLGAGDNPVLRAAPLVAALVVVLLLARRAPRTVWGFTVSAGLVTLTTVLMSKQGHFNYYFFAALAWALAGLADFGHPDPAAHVAGDVDAPGRAPDLRRDAAGPAGAG